MNKIATLPIVCALAFGGMVVLGQEAGQPARPSPEHEKMGYFVGTWKVTGEMMENPVMPAGSFETTDNCRWFDGGFAVVCETEGQGPAGKMTGLGIMAYSPEEKVYTYYGLGNDGMAMTSLPKGTVEGNTWTYLDESEMGGMTVKSRWVMEQLSPTSYTFRWEMQGADGSWQTIMKGKSSKSG